MAEYGMVKWVFIFFAFCLGSCLGSFINAASMRTCAGKKWWGSERSVCDKCGRVLSPLDLIPVVSYIALRGRCRTCGAKIAPRHFYAELGAGVAGALFMCVLGPGMSFIFAFAAMPFLLFHTLTDIQEGYIYDSWAAAMAAVGMLLRISGGWPALINGALGAALGFGLIMIIVLVSRGGMGIGDAMLMLGIGAFYGWQMTILCLYIGFFSGGAVVIPLLIMKKVTRKDAIPLGPFLAAGGILAVFAARFVFGCFGFELPWPWGA